MEIVSCRLTTVVTPLQCSPGILQDLLEQGFGLAEL